MKNRRTIAILLMIAVAISFTACGNNAANAENSKAQEYADQSAFLQDMADGISARLENVGDEEHENDTKEEEAEYYKALVRFELDRIEKYDGAIFEDSEFNALAHHYIHACQMQYSGAENYKNANLYDALWSGGSIIRNSIIATLYEQYDLPISSDEAAYYATNNTVSFSVDFGTNNSPSSAASSTTQVEEPAIDESLFEVKEYSVVKYGNTYHYAIIKNNSEQTVKVDGSAIAKDDSGNVIGADSMDGIDVLGPGEESIGEFYFKDVVGVQTVECQLNYTPQKNYAPVIKNLAAQAFVNDRNVIVQVTNTGDYPADFVAVYVLFFGADGSVVNEEYKYLIDGDNEIKPGATISDQFNSNAEFDHVEVYFKGRG